MRSIPPVTRALLLLNLLAFLAKPVMQGLGVNLEDALGLHFFLAPDFRLWQPLTYMFMHASFSHIFFNMFALWMFGCVIERTLGERRFAVYYLVCGLGAGFIQELAQFGELMWLNPEIPFSAWFSIPEAARIPLNAWATVGASGSVYGVLLAFGMLYPDNKMFIIPFPFPIKAKWFVLGYAAIELGSALFSSGDGVAHVAHLGGMLFGYFLIRHWRRTPPRFQGWQTGRRKPASNFFDKLRRAGRGDVRDADIDRQYNAERHTREQRVDEILDKIRRSGYDSLTREEKQLLFEGC